MPAIRMFCSLYHILLKDVLCWMTVYADGGNFSNSPLLIDSIGISSIYKATKVGRHTYETTRTYVKRISNIVDTEIILTNSRRK